MVVAGEAVAGDRIQDLYRMISGNTLDQGGSGGSEVSHQGLLPAYRDAIVTRNTPLARPVKVVVDCGNGVTSLIAIETLRQVGATVVPLFAESDGHFPNHHPDPTVVENLRDLQRAVVFRRRRSWALPSTATATASAPWTRPAHRSSETSCSSSSAGIRPSGFPANTQSSSTSSAPRCCRRCCARPGSSR